MASPTPLTVVTGASGGIGSAVCAALLERGHHVVGIDPAEPTVVHDRYLHNRSDVTNAFTIAHELAELPGRIRHVVAVAGKVLPSEYQTIERAAATGVPALPAVESFTRSIELNLLGAYHVVAAAVDDLCAGDGDRTVTFCGSVNSMRGFGAVGYSAAKAALSGLTISLAAALGPHGVRVNTVAPGTTPTPRTIELYRDDPEHFDRLADATLLGRLAGVDDIAAAFTALICDLTHVTGQTLTVDGGQTIRV